MKASVNGQELLVGERIKPAPIRAVTIDGEELFRYSGYLLRRKVE